MSEMNFTNRCAYSTPTGATAKKLRAASRIGIVKEEGQNHSGPVPSRVRSSIPQNYSYPSDPSPWSRRTAGKSQRDGADGNFPGARRFAVRLPTRSAGRSRSGDHNMSFDLKLAKSARDRNRRDQKVSALQ